MEVVVGIRPSVIFQRGEYCQTCGFQIYYFESTRPQNTWVIYLNFAQEGWFCKTFLSCSFTWMRALQSYYQKNTFEQKRQKSKIKIFLHSYTFLWAAPFTPWIFSYSFEHPRYKTELITKIKYIFYKKFRFENTITSTITLYIIIWRLSINFTFDRSSVSVKKSDVYWAIFYDSI